MRLRNGNGRADIESLVKEFSVRVGYHVPEGVDRGYLPGVCPAFEGLVQGGCDKERKKGV